MKAEIQKAEVRVVLMIDQQQFVGVGPDTRSAYRDAYRNYRLSRHDVAALLRQVKTLQQTVAVGRVRRRVRYAAAVQAHRTLLREQQQQHEAEMEFCRRRLLERVKESGEWRRTYQQLALEFAALHRRATAAENRCEQLVKGQQSLINAALAAGLEYQVKDTIQFVAIGGADHD